MKFSLADVAGKTEKLFVKAEDVLSLAQENAELNIEDFDSITNEVDRMLKVVFIGQYSAGKSTIVKMLTGNQDIIIDADITTGKCTYYDWNGMQIADTPGIQTGYRKDHDLITYKAISQADLLIFVITNEGFDPVILENFKKIAYDLEDNSDGRNRGLGKINEMILVVNKMVRMGNTKENQDIIRKDIIECLPSTEVSELNICFLDAESYIDSVDEDDPEIKEELLARSGYNSFVKQLNQFAEEKGLAGKLINPLQQLEAILQDSISQLKGTTGNPYADAADGVLRRTINELHRNCKRGERVLKEIILKYAMEIRSLGRELAEALGTDSMEFDDNTIRLRLTSIRNQCQEEIEEKIKEISEDIQVSLNDSVNDDFAKKVNSSIPQNDGSMGAERAKAIFSHLNDFGTKVLSKIDKEMILDIGHFFGKKFKPWEAVKYFKCLQKLNKAIPLIGEVIDFVTEVRDQQKAEEARQELLNARREIVATFNDMANQFENDGLHLIQETFSKQMHEVIDEQETIASTLDVLKKNKSEYVEEMNSIIKDCRRLTAEIRKMTFK